MVAFPYPDADALCQRLRLRGQVISHTEPGTMQHFLDTASELGQLLRAARQYLELACPATPVDPTTHWLWEQGLALPDEMQSGQMHELLHTYANAILQQSTVDPTQRLSAALGMLRTAIGSTH